MNIINSLTDSYIKELSQSLKQCSDKLEHLIIKRQYKLDGFESVTSENATLYNTKTHPENVYTFQYYNVKICIECTFNRGNDYEYSVIFYNMNSAFDVDRKYGRQLIKTFTQFGESRAFFLRSVYLYLTTIQQNVLF